MSCINTTYCIFTGFEPYDGDYTFTGVYDGNDYFTGGTYFIYYSTGDTRWCLATSLGGTCLQFGQTNVGSLCPDLDESFFSVGSCPATTTTTTSPCNIFDFDALFDCIVPTATTTTSTSTTTTTTLPPPPDPCSGVSVSASITAYTTTTTTMPVTTTTTTQVVRPCNFDGTVQFNIFDQYMRCGNSKLFRDCTTGANYYSSALIEGPLGGLPIQDFVYQATINGVSTCVVFVGLVENISGIDNVVLDIEFGPADSGACNECVPEPPPPPPIIPCDCYLLLGGPAPGTSYRTINCNSEETFLFVIRGTTGYTCSQIYPEVVSGGGEVILNSGSCETVDCVAPPPPPPLPCNPITYHISNQTDITNLTFYYINCSGEVIYETLNDYDNTNVCSASLPIAVDPNSPLEIGPLQPPQPCV
jgi:hypothetical protein